MHIEHLNARKSRPSGYVELVPYISPLTDIERVIEAIAGDVSVGASASTLDLARQLLAMLETMPLSVAQMHDVYERVQALMAPLADISSTNKASSMIVGVRTVLGTALALLERFAAIPNAFERHLVHLEPARPRIAPDFAEKKAETVADKVLERMGVKARKPSQKTKDVALRQSRASKADMYAKKREPAVADTRPGVKAHTPSQKTKDVALRQSHANKADRYAKKRETEGVPLK